MRALTTAMARVAGAAVVALTLIAPAEAASILVDTNNARSISGLTGFTTDGSMMSGMLVTAYFGDEFQTLSWATTGLTSGGVSGDRWSLSLNGDSFKTTWAFNNDRAGLLTRLVLDGSTGLTVFDKAVPDPGTDGSESGRNFSRGIGGDQFTATYRNAVGIGTADAVGDLYQILDVEFAGGTGQSFTFTQDTDNELVPVPEPSTLVLFGIGLVGTIRARRRARG